DRAGDFVDAPMERRHVTHVELDEREVLWLAAEQRHDRLDRALHLGRGRPFARIGKLAPRPGAYCHLARFWQLHADDAAVAPRDAADADRSGEEMEALLGHDDRPRHSRI